MSLLLPLDDNGNPLAVLGFDYRGTQRVDVGAVSARNIFPIESDIELVSIISTGACRFEIGDNGVTADADNSPFLYPGIYIDVPLQPGETHIAFITEGEDCQAYVIGRV